jgi:hypothetical protein
MKRFVVIAALVVLGCGGGGADRTAAPALSHPEAQDAAAAIAPILPADDTSPGVITFGKAYDALTLEIAQPLTRFKRTFPLIAWGAHLSHGVAAEFLTWSVASRSDSGVETTVFAVDEPIDGFDVTVLANSGNLARLVDHEPGTYVMRYTDVREVLAEGTFTVVE